MGLHKSKNYTYLNDKIFNSSQEINLLLSAQFMASPIWILGDLKEELDYREEIDLSQELQDKLDKLYEILMTSFDSSYPPDSGFKTIEEVKYFLYYQVYVATLLSSEYKQGKILLYGKDHTLCSIEEYIKYLSSITDEDLKVSLRADLQ